MWYKMSEFYLSNGSNFTLIPVMTAQENNADTIDDLIAKLINKPPALGSCMFNQSKETRLSFTGGSWYNYLYVPHRTGVGGDNASYGNLLLFPMTGPGKAYRVTYSNGHIISVEEFYTNAYPPSKFAVGLGNVDNTADSSKSVKYAASANQAASVKDVGDGRSVLIEYSASDLAYDNFTWIAAYDSTNGHLKTINKSMFAKSSHSHSEYAANDVVTVSSTQPTSSTCKLWIKI